MRARTLLGALLAGSIILSGCATQNATPRQSQDREVDVIGTLAGTHKPLFDKLITPLDKSHPVIAASFTNIDNLSQSSTFGRMASEVVAAGMTGRGYRVIEIKMRESLFIKQRAGEFMLSRELRDISKEHDAQAVLLGTYAVGGSNLYINARLVRTTDNIILSSHDFVLPLNNDLRHMLGDLRRR